MRKGTKHLLGGIALAAGAFGAVGAYLSKRNTVKAKPQRYPGQPGDVWARPGMTVTFRAELMPSREREARTFRVKELLPSGRVLLDGIPGEHAEKEFDPVR